jgi:hypothetical protein
MSAKWGLRGIKKHALSVGGSRGGNMVYLTGLSSEPNLKQ